MSVLLIVAKLWEQFRGSINNDESEGDKDGQCYNESPSARHQIITRILININQQQHLLPILLLKQICANRSRILLLNTLLSLMDCQLEYPRAGVHLLILLLQPSTLLQLIFQTSCLAFYHSHMAIMDCLKIYDSELPLPHHSLLQFLDRKQKSRSADNVSVYTEDMEEQKPSPTRLCPNFSFSFTSYDIGDHVQYNVILNETYRILGRTIVNKYSFRTRYSMLQALDAKLGSMGLPGKKIFGNKNSEFVQKRKNEVQAYLNRVARSGKAEFYKFLQQIKDIHFNSALGEAFSIE